jgi:hypothetical protein
MTFVCESSQTTTTLMTKGKEVVSTPVQPHSKQTHDRETLVANTQLSVSPSKVPKTMTTAFVPPVPKVSTSVNITIPSRNIQGTAGASANSYQVS